MWSKIVLGIITATALTASSQAFAKHVTKSVISTDGTSLYAEAQGNYKGPHLLLIHGLVGATTSYDLLLEDERLTSEFYLVRFDLRGHARSGKPAEREAYTTSAHWAQDVQAVVKAFNLRNPFLVGWSYGGILASDVAAAFAHPLPFSGVIYLSSLPYFNGDVNFATPLVGSATAKMALADNSSIVVQSRIDFTGYLSALNDSLPFTTRATWVGNAAYVAPSTVDALLSRTVNSTRIFEEGAAGWPLLAIMGSKDLFINNEAVQNWGLAHFTDFESHTVKGAGHNVLYDAPKALSSLIIKFVRRVNASSSYGLPPSDGLIRSNVSLEKRV